MLRLECVFKSYFEVDGIYGAGDRLALKIPLYVES